MGKYSVLFDGKWQEKFDDLDEALEWAQAVADTGRLVFVARTHILLPPKLLKIVPEDRVAEGNRLWDRARGLPRAI